MNNDVFTASYEGPKVEIVEVEVENGFGASVGGEGVNWED